jgi:hypothetical protein
MGISYIGGVKLVKVVVAIDVEGLEDKVDEFLGGWLRIWPLLGPATGMSGISSSLLQSAHCTLGWPRFKLILRVVRATADRRTTPSLPFWSPRRKISASLP